jgi:hypothetical protein
MNPWESVISGVNYLRAVQNADGGIPATKPGAPSGCWTSASALCAILQPPFIPIDPRLFVGRLSRFLLKSTIQIDSQSVCWPLVQGGTHGSTMATGHAVRGLLLASNFLHEQAHFSSSLHRIAEQGRHWLKSVQNTDGGWGVEPEVDGEGAQSRLLSTVYALKAFDGTADGHVDRACVKRAVDWIIACRDVSEGGFAATPKSKASASDTSRAIVALLDTGIYAPHNRVIRRAVRFICKRKPWRGLWHLDVERYVAAGAPGQTVFHNNTTADVLLALTASGFCKAATVKLMNWFEQAQRPDGSWYLGANNEFIEDVTTWSTTEALEAMAAYMRLLILRSTRLIKYWRRRFGCCLVALMTTSVLFFLQATGILAVLFKTTSAHRAAVIDGLVNFFVYSVMGGIVGTIIYDRIKRRRD